MNWAMWWPVSAPLPKRASVTCGRNLRRSTSMPQWRATLETFCCSQSSRSLFSTRATSALGCLPLENCSTPAMATAKGGPAMSDSSSSRSRITAPCTRSQKQSVTWKFSGVTQRASGTPDCSATSSSEMSSGTGRAMNNLGIGVEVLGGERQQTIGDDLGTAHVGMQPVGLIERRLLGHALEDEGIERHLILVRQPLIEAVERR